MILVSILLVIGTFETKIAVGGREIGDEFDEERDA
jgi:hypothetical protein